MNDGQRLRGLIDAYWTLAYREGRDGREHDTSAGDAQHCLNDIESTIARMEAARSECVQEVEPVAWWNGHLLVTLRESEPSTYNWSKVIPLYTHPQPAQQGSVPEGWKLVPVKPTEEMRDAARNAYKHGYSEVYRKTLEAAPQPPKEQ